MRIKINREILPFKNVAFYIEDNKAYLSKINIKFDNYAEFIKSNNSFAFGLDGNLVYSATWYLYLSSLIFKDYQSDRQMDLYKAFALLLKELVEYMWNEDKSKLELIFEAIAPQKLQATVISTDQNLVMTVVFALN